MLHRSRTNSVRTPPWLLEYIEAQWGPFFDPVPFKVDFDKHLDPDALKIPWKRVNYVNPPYSRPKFFVKKAAHLWRTEGKVSVVLLKTEVLGSKYFKTLCEGAELRFISKHLTFVGYSKPAPFASMLVIYDGKAPGSYSVL